ncbi:hypothetical protein [Alkalilimnicola ehrlichii]|uniref:hypothetical protein n=1 Tax=Alkalilimnicola ehrlichii TaxID=351052 RepID=UPI0011C02CD2|nr:hypothetical protein [Alkalilimnicola ehrlichii]
MTTYDSAKEGGTPRLWVAYIWGRCRVCDQVSPSSGLLNVVYVRAASRLLAKELVENDISALSAHAFVERIYIREATPREARWVPASCILSLKR